VGKEPLPGSWPHPAPSATGWGMVTVAELSVFIIIYLREIGLLVLSSATLKLGLLSRHQCALLQQVTEIFKQRRKL
jgi:hypothetical protein